jgi:hypothetical protein
LENSQGRWVFFMLHNGLSYLFQRAWLFYYTNLLWLGKLSSYFNVGIFLECILLLSPCMWGPHWFLPWLSAIVKELSDSITADRRCTSPNFELKKMEWTSPSCNLLRGTVDRFGLIKFFYFIFSLSFCFISLMWGGMLLTSRFAICNWCW